MIKVHKFFNHENLEKNIVYNSLKPHLIFKCDNCYSYFSDGNLTTGCTDRIESLRPKSPPPKLGGRGRGGRGRGRGGRSDMRGGHRGAM